MTQERNEPKTFTIPLTEDSDKISAFKLERAASTKGCEERVDAGILKQNKRCIKQQYYIMFTGNRKLMHTRFTE